MLLGRSEAVTVGWGSVWVAALLAEPEGGVGARAAADSPPWVPGRCRGFLAGHRDAPLHPSASSDPPVTLCASFLDLAVTVYRSCAGLGKGPGRSWPSRNQTYLPCPPGHAEGNPASRAGRIWVSALSPGAAGPGLSPEQHHSFGWGPPHPSLC